MKPIRIGSRGSPLALAQAQEVKRQLAAVHALAAGSIEVKVIRTTGDAIQHKPLAGVGGKGLFTKEIEEALFAGDIDIAVHSAKDMTAFLPDGLVIGAILPRENPCDAFISLKYGSFAALPPGAAVGTSSPRRAAQALHLRPDLKISALRGNVETRLAKLREGVVEATFLAVAGLKRLNLAHAATALMAPEEMLPAVAQGALALEIRAGDRNAAGLIAPLNDPLSAACITAERAFLAVLEGSCRSPVAALARPEGPGIFRLEGRILSPDGRKMHTASRTFVAAASRQAGEETARDVIAQAGSAFFQAWA